MYFIFHLIAGHSRKGNPRRLYVVYFNKGENLSLVDVIEEGYEGIARLIEKYPNYHLVTSFEITSKEYKRLLNESRANLYGK